MIDGESYRRRLKPDPRNWTAEGQVINPAPVARDPGGNASEKPGSIGAESRHMSENKDASATRGRNLGGWRIFLIVIVCLLGIAIVAVVWLIVRSPQGKQAIEFARASSQVMMRAGRAPGTSELKKTLCGEAALVLDLDEFRKLQTMLHAREVTSSVHAQVICVPGNKAPVPACSDVAQTWLKAAGSAHGDFEVIVKAGTAKEIHCAKLYSTSGEEIGEGHVSP